MHVTLLTRGSPLSVTWGFLYHRRLADAAADHGACLTFEQESWRWRPSRGADVVVLDSIGAWRMLPAVLRRGRTPYVAIVHQRPGGVDGPRAWRWVQARLDVAVYRRCAPIIAASPTLAEALRRAGVDGARVVVLEPGCDPPAAPPVADMRRGRRVAVLSVGNWFPNKGVLELLEAFAGLLADAATLHLVGRDEVDPPYTARVRARLDRADLAGRVVVHGAVDPGAVAGLYAGADVFALATTVEGYATVFAEALAHGLPVVGWRRPFLEHFIRDGVEGRMAELGDVPGLTAALADVVADDRRRARLAAAAAQRGATLPTWAQTASRFFALLRARAETVEPAHDGPVRTDVDAAHPGVLDDQPPGERAAGAERPVDRRLDRADVGHDDDGR